MTILARQVSILVTLFLLTNRCESQTINLSTIYNIAYLDVPNAITSNINKRNCDAILFETDNGTVKKENCDVIFTPKKIGPAKIEIFTVTNRKKSKIGESTFRVHPISNPYARYAGQTGGRLSKEIVKVNNGLWQFHITELECQPYFKVDKYSVIVIKSDKTILMTENTGAKFEDATVDIVEKLDKGDRLIFSQIIIETPDKIKRIVNPIEFVIE
jgi:hypothetical protein